MKKFLCILILICIIFYVFPVTYADSTSVSPLSISSIKCTDSSGNPIYTVKGGMSFNITFSAGNTSSLDTEIHIFTAVYEKEQRLKHITKVNKTVSANTSDIQFTIPTTLPNINFNSVKIMIWDSKLTSYSPPLVLSGKYELVNLSDYANGKFYVDPTNSEELKFANYNTETSSGKVDFPWFDAGIDTVAAVKYPIVAGEISSNCEFNEDMTVVTGNSGIPYKMPNRLAGAANKEAIGVCEWYTGAVTADIENDVFNKIHLLVASTRDSGNMPVKVTVSYTDNSTKEIELNVETRKNTSADNFVAALNSLCYFSGEKTEEADNRVIGNSSFNFMRTTLYEYTIETDAFKTVDKITFNATGNTGYNCMISSITVEQDWDAIVSELRNDIEDEISALILKEQVSTPEIDAVNMKIKGYVELCGGVRAELAGIDEFDNIISYTYVNLTPYANGKFYVDPTKSEELLLSTYNNENNIYGKYDFAWHNANIGNKAAAVYPLAASDGSSVLSSEDGLLHSKSGIRYAMPVRRQGVADKEAVALSLWYADNVNVDIENAVYSKMHFLIATASDSECSKFNVSINYSDGSRETSDAISAYGYTQNETASDNFITYLSKRAALNGTDLNNSIGNYVKLALYEYSISVNPQKVVDSVTFSVVDDSANYTDANPYGGRTFMVTSLTTQKNPTGSIVSNIENKISSSEHLEYEIDALNRLTTYLEQQGISRNEISNIDALPEANNSDRIVYVSTTGSDISGIGTFEKPFASIPKACEFINANSHYLGNWKVVLRGGRYNLDSSITLNEKTLKSFSHVIFTSHENETVIISGAKQIDMTYATTVSEAAKARLPQSSADKVVQVDLKTQGIENTVPYSPINYGESRQASSIIIDDLTYKAARWPNEDYAIIDTCINNGNNGDGLSFTVRDIGTSNIDNWNTADNALLNGFFSDSDWRFDILSLDNVNSETGAVTSSANPGVTMGTMSHPRRFFIDNLLEEIDAPGEWYIDNNTGMLYLYPTSANANVYISTLTDAMFEISNINNVHFKDLIFNGSVESALQFNHSNNSSVENCNIKNISGYAINFNQCINSGVQSCDMSYLGSRAVSVYGTNYRTMENGGIYIDDCKINKFSMLSRGAAINSINSIGLKITHNEISESPWAAIVSAQAINSLIEYNDISKVQQDYADAGAIYSGRSFISQGNIIRYNYIHDLDPYSNELNGYTNAIYMDDLNCGFEIYGNVINRAQIGIVLGGGKNLTVRNNIIINGNVTNGIHTINADNRGRNWAATAAGELATELKTFTKNYPLFAEKFPHVTGIYYNSEFCGYPTNNSIINNFYYDAKTEYICNEYSDNVNYKNTKSNNYKFGTNASDNISGSPFIDEENGDFTLKENSIVTERISGFEPIPFKYIGLKNKR